MCVLSSVEIPGHLDVFSLAAAAGVSSSWRRLAFFRSSHLKDLSNRRQFPSLHPVKFSILQLLPMPSLALLDMSSLEKSSTLSHIPSLQVFYRLLRHIFPELVPTRDTVQCLAVQSPLLVCGLHNGEVSHIQLLLI